MSLLPPTSDNGSITVASPPTESQDSEIALGDDAMSSPPSISRKAGRFLPGKSGNPKGRPQGSKNALSLIRQETESELREWMRPKAKRLLQKAYEMAMDGNEKVLIALLDKVLASMRTQDAGDTMPTEITFQINNLTTSPHPKRATVEVIDGEAVEVQRLDPPTTQTKGE